MASAVPHEPPPMIARFFTMGFSRTPHSPAGAWSSMRLAAAERKHMLGACANARDIGAVAVNNERPAYDGRAQQRERRLHQQPDRERKRACRENRAERDMT